MKDKAIALLHDLMRLDHALAQLYQRALVDVAPFDLKDHMTRLRDHHHMHVTALTDALRELARPAPVLVADPMAAVELGLTVPPSESDLAVTLRALDKNERLLERRYDSARRTLVPPEVRKVVEVLYDEQREHVELLAQLQRDYQRPASPR